MARRSQKRTCGLGFLLRHPVLGALLVLAFPGLRQARIDR
jgi:hypothetical protein